MPSDIATEVSAKSVAEPAQQESQSQNTEPLTPTVVDEKKDGRSGSVDLECKESMPSPEKLYISCQYPYKKTYCGIELSAEDGAGLNAKAPESPQVIPAAAEDDVPPSYEPVDSSYVPQEPGVSYSSYSPTSPSELDECEAECAKATIRSIVGKTYYPIKAEKMEEDEPTPPVSPESDSPPVSPRVGSSKGKSGSPPVSPRVGRTKGERTTVFRALTNGLPKLQRFSPPISKKRVREDSAPLEEDAAPAQCCRALSDAV